jgi:phosphoribosylglycinamide formyltransferase 1
VPFTAPTFAVLASGAGSNFEALAAASRRQEFRGSIALLAVDNADAPALERARRLDIESVVLPVGRYRTRIEDELPWIDALRARGVDALLLAGFMRRLHAPMLRAFPDRILNIHPSLLPSFPGLDAVRQALEHGVKVTGCTVHVVREAVDAGPIVAQAAVDVRDEDTLETLTARVHAAEHRLYPAAVRRYFEGGGIREAVGLATAPRAAEAHVG